MVGITAGILTLAGYASAATLGSEKYTYDASGNIIEKSIDGVVTKMAYDKANRLIGRQVDGQAKQTTAYDAAGRPVTERNADGQTTRSMSYGYGDKVLEMQSRDSKAGFFYNAEGQLVGKKTDFGVAIYTWDGNVLAADGAETFTNEAHLSGGLPLLNGGNDIVISDYLGNTLASGINQFASTAYGEGLEDGRFTGKMFIKELGCYAFNFRLYSPAECRWTSHDPSGFPDGINSRLYANGSPLDKLDPLGLEEEVPLEASTYPEFTIHDKVESAYIIPKLGETPYIPKIYCKLTSTYSSAPLEATMVQITGTGSPATDWSWSNPSVSLASIPVPAELTEDYGTIVKGKKRWVLYASYSAKYNRPSTAPGGEEHTVCHLKVNNSAQIELVTAFAREP